MSGDQLKFVQQRLAADRRLMSQLLSGVLTDAQLDSRPACLHWLTVHEARISWGAEFSPRDKFPRVAKAEGGAA